ncbi:MAG: mannose-6-phosphate isomerase, class I, partial [Saprospiraceae bacterium]|nr:mannose-6-phosphate isomerase, class I [Saprospiraceae bacterium]
MIRLKGSLQHYDWGGYEFISNLIRRSVPEDKPLAELWLGTHPRGPALTEGGTPLPDLLTEKPRRFLGHRQSDGQLPFLFKVLDVRQMLSIQVHPGKSEAEAGFEREDKLGIPIGAPHRNFKDRNHKPELMVALSPFWLLHGFREEKEIIALLSDITGSQRLIRTLEEEGL